MIKGFPNLLTSIRIIAPETLFVKQISSFFPNFLENFRNSLKIPIFRPELVEYE